MILLIKDSLQQQILLMATSSGTNAVVVMRVNCISIVSDIHRGLFKKDWTSISELLLKRFFQPKSTGTPQPLYNTTVGVHSINSVS